MKRAVAVLASLSLLALGAGCGSDDGAGIETIQMPSESPTTESTPEVDDDEAVGTEPPTIEAAEAAAQEYADRYSAGDFSGAYDMWTTQAQKLIGRKGYVRFAEACARVGVALQVEGGRMEGDEKAVVRVGVAGYLQSYTMVHQDGTWRWQPPTSDRDDFRLGAGKAIDKHRAAGTCAGG